MVGLIKNGLQRLDKIVRGRENFGIIKGKGTHSYQYRGVEIVLGEKTPLNYTQPFSVECASMEGIHIPQYSENEGLSDFILWQLFSGFIQNGYFFQKYGADNGFKKLRPTLGYEAFDSHAVPFYYPHMPPRSNLSDCDMFARRAIDIHLDHNEEWNQIVSEAEKSVLAQQYSPKYYDQTMGLVQRLSLPMFHSGHYPKEHPFSDQVFSEYTPFFGGRAKYPLWTILGLGERGMFPISKEGYHFLRIHEPSLFHAPVDIDVTFKCSKNEKDQLIRKPFFKINPDAKYLLTETLQLAQL